MNPDEASKTTLSDLTRRILEFRDARDWGQFHGLKDEVLSLVTEVGELAEHFRWHTGEDLREQVDARRTDVADELADVLYWTLLLSHDAGIDLTTAFERKMRQNEDKYPVDTARGRAVKYTDL